MTPSIAPLFDWMNKLRAAKIHFNMASVRDDAVMLEVSVPGERWEVEFFPNGTIEVERFLSPGKIEGASALDELLSRFSDLFSSRERGPRSDSLRTPCL